MAERRQAVAYFRSLGMKPELENQARSGMALSKDDLRKQAETSSVNTDLKAKDDDNDQQRLERRRQTRWQMGAFP
jgi:hypothetical protein